MIASFEEIEKLTFPMLARMNFQKDSRKEALLKKEFGIWRPINWADLYHEIKLCFYGLKRLGLENGDKVCILAENDPQWYVAEFAVQSAGGVAVGIIADCTSSEIEYLVQNSDARYIFVDDQEQIDKLLEIKEKIPNVQKVIYWDDKGMWGYQNDWLISFEKLLDMGKQFEATDPVLLDKEIDKGKPDDTALFIYTSGTSGFPKAVQLSYKNFLSAYLSSVKQFPEDAYRDGDKVISFHFPGISGEQLQYVCGLLTTGVIVCFPEEPETAAADTREVAPASVLYLPRFYQALASNVRAKMDDSSFIKILGYKISLAVGYKLTELSLEVNPKNIFWKALAYITDGFGSLQIRDKMGLLHTRLCITGSAGIGPELFHYFRALKLNLIQGYGASETCASATRQSIRNIDFGACGQPSICTEIRIDDNGEVLIRGANVFSGYYKNSEATQKLLNNGWWHSGDAGHLTDDGQLVIVGRISDLAKLNTGALYSPVYIENSLSFSPYISDAMVIGKDRRFISAVVIIDFANIGRWAEKRGIAYTTYLDLSQKPEVYKLVQNEINRVNHLLPVSTKIRRFVNFYKEFDADEGELTRTRKLRRGILEERFGDLIEALYGDSDHYMIESEIIYHDGRKGKIKADLQIKEVGIVDGNA